MTNLKVAFAVAVLIYLAQLAPDLIVARIVANQIRAIFAPIETVMR